MKDGAIIHVERGYQIAEVLERVGEEHELCCVGFRLIGPQASEGHVYTTEQQGEGRARRVLPEQFPDLSGSPKNGS
jgi:hypothetical protein